MDDLTARTAFLDEACAGRPEVRHQVEALLKAHEISGRFLEGGVEAQRSDPRGAAEIDLPEVKAGLRIGPYRLIGQIGEGGTSKVFAAEQEEPVRRWVAVKVLKPGMDSRQVLLRFALERQALALMDHPGIAKFLDAGATRAGHPFFVMELVSGMPITSYCDESQLSIPRRLELFGQVCTAVLHAHQRGIIHRDLKPDNILVRECDGRIDLKIIDFGIAKVLHAPGAESATQAGAAQLLGTPAYMSPEQVQMTSAGAEDVDTRTDIYSLGALLYELLTGHPPFDHDTLINAGLEEMCRLIRAEDPLAPSVRVTRLSPQEQAEIAAARATTAHDLPQILAGDLDSITLKALEKPRQQRYATALGLAEDIGRHAESLPVSAAAQTWRYRAAKLLRRNRKLAIAGGISGAIGVITSIVVIAMTVYAQQSAQRARAMEETAREAERESHRAMVAVHVSSGMLAVEDGAYDRAILWYATAARAAGSGNDQFESNARRVLSWMSRVSIPRGAFQLPSSVQRLEFSRDARFLVATGSNREWKLWDLARGDSPPWVRDVGAVEASAWSPAGSRLIIARADGEIRIHELPSGQLSHAFHLPRSATDVAFTSESQLLVLSDHTLRSYSLEPGTAAPEFPTGAGSIVGLSVPRPATHAVAIDAGGTARLLVTHPPSEGDEATAVSRTFPHEQAVRTALCANKSSVGAGFSEGASPSSPSLDPIRSRLATRTGPFEVTLWDTAQGSPLLRIKDACCSSRFITCPEAGILACGLQGGRVGIWDVVTGAPRELLPSRGACIVDIAFGGRGNNLIVAEASGTARLWSLRQAREVQSPLHHSADLHRVAYSHDGTVAATAQSDGLVRIWSVPADEARAPATSGRGIPVTVSMDSRGERFVVMKAPGWEGGIRNVSAHSTHTGERIGRAVNLDGDVEAAALAPIPRLIAVAVGPVDGTTQPCIEIHDLDQAASLVRRVALPARPVALTWHPTGSLVVVLCQSGELLAVPPQPDGIQRWGERDEDRRARSNADLQFTTDGTAVVSLGPSGVIEVRDGTTGQLRFPPLKADPDAFWSFSLCKDGHHMATTTTTGTVAVWTLDSGAQLGEGIHSSGRVYRCRFSPDHSTLVTAAYDGRVSAWDWRTGMRLYTPMVHPSEVYDAVFSHDSRWVLTACRDGNMRIWDVATSQLLAPPIEIGEQAFHIELTPDGQRAVVAGLGKDVTIVSLDLIAGEVSWSSDELCLLAEVLSSCTIENGSMRTLSSAEWMDRYERLNRVRPSLLTLQPFGLHRKVSLAE